MLVNTAGILRDRMIFNLPEQDWDAVIRVHLRGHFSTIKPAAAYWREQRNPDGHYRIINFTSDSALHGSPGQPNYAAAKMGIIGLTMSLANALGRYGVTANAIAPAAATRLTATIPTEKSVGVSASENTALSPDNIAPDRRLPRRHRVRLAHRAHPRRRRATRSELWSAPEVVETVASDGPWNLGDLAAKVEKSFRPKADGPPPSLFMGQIPR